MIDQNIIFGITVQEDGQMRLKGNDFLKNRKRYFNKQNLDFNKIVSAQLSHGNRVVIVEEKEVGKIIPGTDALITDQPNLILTVSVADCMPIFLYSSDKKVVALAHVGWRGLSQEILRKVVILMLNSYQLEKKEIKVYVGPCIKSCHFEIQDDVKKVFRDYKSAIIERDSKTFLDLGKIAQLQLLKLGISSDNVKISSDCTYCLAHKYFSYRRNKDEEIKAMLAYILIKE